jgi:hypothetical protein
MLSVAELVLENPLATVFGVVGLLNQLIWPLLRARKAILIAQFGIGADYSVHYALLDAWSGAGVAGLGALQTLIAYFAADRPWLARIAPAFPAAVAAACGLTWAGSESALALIACTLIMIGRMRRDTVTLRAFLLTAAPFGIAYDALVGAVPAFIGAVVSACIAAVMLARELRARRAAAPAPVQVAHA